MFGRTGSIMRNRSRDKFVGSDTRDIGDMVCPRRVYSGERCYRERLHPVDWVLCRQRLHQKWIDYCVTEVKERRALQGSVLKNPEAYVCMR